MTPPDWLIGPYSPPELLEENLLRVEASIPKMTLRRVMTVARRKDGQVVIHNAVCLRDEDMERIEALGEPGFLVVPNGYHRLNANAMLLRYPKMKVVCPKGARAKVQEVVRVDLTYDEFPEDDSVSLLHLHGAGDKEGAMVVRSEAGTTVVLNDVLFNMPHQTGFAGWIFRHVTQSSGGPRVSRIARWFIVKDKGVLREELLRLAQEPNLRRIIVSHHEPITENIEGAVRAAVATWG